MVHIGIFHPDLTRQGGAVTVAAHLIDLLVNNHEVTLYTTVEPCYSELNDRYGTNIQTNEVSVHNVSLASVTVIKKAASAINKLFNTNLSLDALKFAFIQRHVRATPSIQEDIYISAVNELFLDTPSIQYIHFPTFSGGGDTRHITWTSNNLHAVYREICKAIVGVDNMGTSAVLVTNSEWTKNIVQDTYDRPVKVVYPPINLEDFDRSRRNREDGFVTIGAIHHRKRQVKMIKIIDRLKEIGIDTHLHIIGGIGDKSYFNKIKQMARNRDYIYLEGFVERKELIDIIERHKYGLHGRPNEHFGIGIAEIVAGGGIPFVPEGGGQTEIINNRSELQYDNIEDAVKKISMVFDDPDLQQDLKTDLHKFSSQYSVEEFRKRILEIVTNLEQITDDASGE